MFRKKAGKKKNNYLFIFASLMAFSVCSLFVFLLLGNTLASRMRLESSNSALGNKYFLNENYQHRDPFTTKVPNLSDMLRGPIISKDDPSRGDLLAPITIIMFSDFECSYCSEQEKIIKELFADYNLRLVWKDYPNWDRHSRSFRAAEAARCSQAQGKFWSYHDELYKDNKDLSEEKFISIAEKLDLEIEDFKQCLISNKTDFLINNNILEAEALDIEGVPFLFVNDQETLGGGSREDLEKIIKVELAETDKAKK